MKFTFKTDRPTGLYRTFNQPFHYIKLKKIVVGYIWHEAPFTIRLKVIKSDIKEDGNPNCIWKWIKLKKESTSLQEAKDFLNERIEGLTARYNLVKE
jgi:hypothetical protein